MAWRKYKKELRIMKKIKCIYSKAEKLWRDEEMLYEVLEYMYLVLLCFYFRVHFGIPCLQYHGQ